MKIIRILLAVLVVHFCSACFEVGVLVHVKPDGSGTIEQSVSVSTAMLAQAKLLGGDKGKAPTEINEEELRAAALALGEGVTFVGAKKIEQEGREGYTATFAFTDIGRIHLDLSKMGQAAGPGVEGKSLTVGFKKGNPSELVLSMPKTDAKDQEKLKAAQTPEMEAMAEQMLPMMAQMFKGARMRVELEFEGAIVDTNATHREGSRITFMDVEFDKIMADPAKFKVLSKVKDPTSPEARELLKGMPGVKVETENPIRVRFQ